MDVKTLTVRNAFLLCCLNGFTTLWSRTMGTNTQTNKKCALCKRKIVLTKPPGAPSTKKKNLNDICKVFSWMKLTWYSCQRPPLFWVERINETTSYHRQFSMQLPFIKVIHACRGGHELKLATELQRWMTHIQICTGAQNVGAACWKEIGASTILRPHRCLQSHKNKWKQ